MSASARPSDAVGSQSILLFNDECAVCRAIGNWVRKSASRGPDETRLIVRPIGDDPDALHRLNGSLTIWDAYATIHLLMSDGSMKTGGEAVAEVFRRLPSTQWFSGLFGLRLFGFMPFQKILNLGYTLLSDVRPLFGCESCGAPSVWVRPLSKRRRPVCCGKLKSVTSGC